MSHQQTKRPRLTLEEPDDSVTGNDCQRKQLTLDQFWSNCSNKNRPETQPVRNTGISSNLVNDEEKSPPTHLSDNKESSQLPKMESETLERQRNADEFPYADVLTEQLDVEKTSDPTVSEISAASVNSNVLHVNDSYMTQNNCKRSASENGDDTQAYDDSDDLFSPEPSSPSSAAEALELGTPINELPTNFNILQSLPALQSAPDHVILFAPFTLDTDWKLAPTPEPTMADYNHWDDSHVRMPYSAKNRFIEDKIVKSRWAKIKSSLTRKKWTSSHDIEQAVMSYNSKYKWDFTELHNYFALMCPEERKHFFENTLPKMAELAVSLEVLCTKPIPLLCQQVRSSVTMSQQQAACLLANAFFCTFPARNFSQGTATEDRPQLPSINFNTLYRRASRRHQLSQHAKFDCLLNYFRRVTSHMPGGTLTFERKVLTDKLDWSASDAKLQPLCIIADGFIEDCGHGLLQVDFANKVIGGGVLGEGCVQEEIRFIVCPELIVSRLITEELAENETVIITGSERFSNYSGYGSSTRWLSDHVDDTPRDSWGRRCTEIVAMDASVFYSFRMQLNERYLVRELNKAYCGFQSDASRPSAVATGNWGCGVFGGDPRLKAIVQIMAASAAQRPVCYLTFGDRSLCQDLHVVYKYASSAGCTVGFLWSCIQEVARRTDKPTSVDLYRLIVSKCSVAGNSSVCETHLCTNSTTCPETP